MLLLKSSVSTLEEVMRDENKTQAEYNCLATFIVYWTMKREKGCK